MVKRTHITHIAGNINGVEFWGEGEGVFDLNTSVSEGKIRFKDFPKNFLPILCRSWKCKHHSGIGIFPKRNYNMEKTMIYNNGKLGKIMTRGAVREISPNTTEAFSEFYGTYSGRLDIDEILIFRETYTPLGNDTYHITGYRKIKMKDGSIVEMDWYGRLKVFVEDEWKAVPFSQEYKVLHWSFERYGSIALFNKRMEVIKIVGDKLEVKPVTLQELKEAYEIYYRYQKRELNQLEIRIEDVPIFTIDTFKDFLEDESKVILGARYEGKLVGIGIASLESKPDDLLFGPYGDILLICVDEDYRGLGVESKLFIELSDWLKSRGSRKIRTTVIQGSEREKLLWESLGAKEILQRLEI
jgi:ribosomal protein S18 acetylase RimI-like enzyme